MSRRRKWLFVGLVGYVAAMAAVGGSLWRARRWATTELAQSSSVDEWQQWKDEVAASNETDDAPVKRRLPKSDEPPALVLLRDGFAGVMGGTLVMASFLYAAAAFFVWGIFLADRTIPEGGNNITAGGDSNIS